MIKEPSEYTTIKTYSIKIKNVKKIEELCEKYKISASKLVNKLIEEKND